MVFLGEFEFGEDLLYAVLDGGLFVFYGGEEGTDGRPGCEFLGGGDRAQGGGGGGQGGGQD